MTSYLRATALLAALLLLAPATGVRADVTSLTIGSAAGPPGATVAVELVAEATAPGIGAYTVDVQYDPNLLTIVGCVPAASGLALCNPIMSAGSVRFTGADAAGLTGRVVLGGIVFTAGPGEGVSELSVKVVQLTDPAPNNISVSPQNGSVTVRADVTSSVPATSTGGPTVFLASDARAGTTPGVQQANVAEPGSGQDSGGSGPGVWLLAAAGILFVAGGLWAVARMRRPEDASPTDD